MKTISMLELRSKGRDIIRRLKRGERLTLTYRGRKVATLLPEPLDDDTPVASDDPIHTFAGMAEPMGPLTNEEIDQTLYGEQSDLR
jgi:antitoxin (DNA-binding transcriptional repressor) of toxin-antitoxin stability system